MMSALYECVRNCSSFLLERPSQFSHRYDLRRHGRADILAWPNAFDPARRARTRDMHLSEAQGAKFSGDQLIIDQSLDRLQREGCPVVLSLFDGKLSSEARCADETGGDGEGRERFREFASNLVGHANVLLLRVLKPPSGASN